jgi:hypothetical protein
MSRKAAYPTASFQLHDVKTEDSGVPHYDHPYTGGGHGVRITHEVMTA